MYSFVTSGNFIIFKHIDDLPFAYTEEQAILYEKEVFKLHNTSKCIDWSLTEDTTLITFTIDESRYENVPLSSIEFDDVVCGTQADFIDGVQGMFENLSGGGSGGGVESVTAGDGSITVGGTATNPTVKLPYLVYEALLTQAGGVSAPVATVKTNTIGDIVWSKSDVGVYLATLNGAFPTGRTAVITGSILGFFYPELTGDFIVLTTIDSNGANQDSLLNQAFIQIRVYPA